MLLQDEFEFHSMNNPDKRCSGCTNCEGRECYLVWLENKVMELRQSLGIKFQPLLEEYNIKSKSQEELEKTDW
jgi:hypothetical protein